MQYSESNFSFTDLYIVSLAAMASYYSSQCFTGPPSLSTLSESTVVKLLLSKTRTPYSLSLARHWKLVDDQYLMKCLEISTSDAKLQYLDAEYQKIIPFILKKEEPGYISKLVQNIASFVFWIFGTKLDENIERIFGNNSSACFERERSHLRLADIIKHHCEQPEKERVIYLERISFWEYPYAIDATQCDHRIQHGACIYDFPLEVTITSINANFSFYSVLFQNTLPLNTSSRLLQKAMDKLTGRYVLNATYEDFYYWCEKFFLILSLARHFSRQGIEVRIFDIEYGAACAIMAWLEELQLTDVISTLKLFFRLPSSTILFSVPNCSFYKMNLSTFKHLHTLSLHFCDCKTLRQLRHCSLKSLSIRSLGMKKSALLTDFLGVKDTSSEFLHSHEWINQYPRPTDFEIVGSNLSSSLQYLVLPVFLGVINKYYTCLFPNLIEYVTPYQRYKLHRSRQFSVETMREVDSMHFRHEEDHTSVMERIREEKIKYEKELDLSTLGYMTSVKDLEKIDAVRKYCKAHFISKLNVKFYSEDSHYQISTDDELNNLLPYIDNTHLKVYNIRLSRIRITKENFHELSLLENIEELTFATFDIKADYCNPCRRYFPSLTKVSFEIKDELLPHPDVIRCLFSGGKVQTMYITLSSPSSFWSCKLLQEQMVSFLMCKHLCSLTHLCVDVRLLSRPFFKQLRLLPHLQTFTFILTNGTLMSNFFSFYGVDYRDDSYLKYFHCVPSYINTCVSTNTADLNQDSALIWR